MKRTNFMLAGLGAIIAGCARGSSRPFDVLNASSDPLRSRFNSAAGKVRVLMLVSPT
jgi:hypothetical protein